MGQVPPKYFYPSAPYGSSEAVNSLNAVQPTAQNPQVPLLPPNFSDPAAKAQGAVSSIRPQNPMQNTMRPRNPLLYGMFMLLFCASLHATTAVTGKIQTLGTGNVTNGAFVRFWLRGCGGNQPRVNGTAVIAPSQGGVYFIDLPASTGGAVSGTIYSTRDSTGLLGGDIECGGSTTAAWYGMQIFQSGKGGPETPISANNTGIIDISNVTPITTSPIVNAPTGDTTYARLDGGNQPFLGSLTPISNGVLNLGSSTNRWNGFFNTADFRGGSTYQNPASTSGTGVLLNEASPYTVTVPNAGSLTLFNLIFHNTATTTGGAGGGIFYGLNITTDSDAIDTAAGIAVQNNGKSDNIYLGVAGKAGAAASTPTGIGVDLNRVLGGANENSTANNGKGLNCWDWSQTDQGAGGPNCLFLNKQNKSYTGHYLAYLTNCDNACLHINSPQNVGFTANSPVFQVAQDSSGKVYWDVGNEGQTRWGNGPILYGYSDNLATLQWRINSLTGVASFNNLAPLTAGAGELGDVLLPYPVLYLGASATNNFRFAPVALSAGRTIQIADPGIATVQMTMTIASGTATMTTAAIAAGACGTVVTVAASGVVTSDRISFSSNAGVGTPNGLLIINSWPTGGNVNFNYCNPTASTQTPTAETLNWGVTR